ncbi:Homeobox domain-containing protein [Pseudozyma hubeiensis]|nr:Homeobox domain-containing protein [Pseudozyma hubeiensis]
MSERVDQDSAFYSEILSLAAQISCTLPAASIVSEETARKIQILPLCFIEPDQQALDHDLSRLDLSKVCQSNLMKAFFAQLEVLQGAYEHEYAKVIETLQRKGMYEKGYDEAFRSLLTRQFASRLQMLWSVILDEVKGFTWAETAQSEFAQGNRRCRELSEEVSLKISRGHDSDAVRILEQAFEHTPNITQAEKFQLAEATGLQPKQVTIWFQNRRNRKGKKGPKLAITSQSDSDPSFFRNEHPPPSPTRDFTLSEKKRKSYGALGRGSLDSSSDDSDSPSSLPKKPRLPSADSDVSDGSASSYEHHGAFTCWSTPSSRSNSSSLDSSGMSDFDSPRKPRNVFDYMKPRTLDVKAITSMPKLTIPAPQQHASTNATPGQRSPFLCDNASNNVATGTTLDFGGLRFNLNGVADDQSFRESVQRVLSGMSGYEADTSRNVSSSSWTSQQTTTDDDGWEDVDDSVASHVTAGSQSQHASMPTQVDAMSGQEVAQAIQPSRAQSAPLAHTSNGDDNSQPQLFDDNSFDLSQFFQSASMPTHMPSFITLPQQHGLFQVPLPAHNTQELGEIEKPLDMDLDDIQTILDSNIFASSLPSSQQSNGGSAPNDTSVQGRNAAAGAEMGEGVFQMNFDLDSNSFGFV